MKASMKIQLLFFVLLSANLQAMNNRINDNDVKIRQTSEEAMEAFIASINSLPDHEKNQIIQEGTLLNNGEGEIRSVFKNIPVYQWAYWINQLIPPADLDFGKNKRRGI